MKDRMMGRDAGYTRRQTSFINLKAKERLRRNTKEASEQISPYKIFINPHSYRLLSGSTDVYSSLQPHSQESN